jgi:DNA-binding transcriptional regulator of glucitol operon
MAKWQIALALLVAAVALHVFGVARQIYHYRQVFRELSTRWRGQRIGTGVAGGRFAPAALAILVADDAGIVQAASLRLGAGSFAKFEPRPELVGIGLAELATRAAANRGAPAGQALAAAVADLERRAGEAGASS